MFFTIFEVFFDFLTWFGPPEVRITQHLATLKDKILFLVPQTYWKVSLRYVMFFYSNDSLGGSSRTIDDLMALPELI